VHLFRILQICNIGLEVVETTFVVVDLKVVTELIDLVEVVNKVDC
jgi:hypothetical protein